MKVRFYRGPWDGKIKHLGDSMDYIVMATYAGNIYTAAASNLTGPVAMTNENHVYRKTRHTHPDGSVYFEWDKPKGTKWNKNPRPKKLQRGQQVNIWPPLP